MYGQLSRPHLTTNSSIDNVILTMHTAGITEEARQRQGVYAAEQWLQIAAGKRPARLVNPSAWDGAR